MELVGVTDGGPDLADRIAGQFQQLSRLDHAVTDQKFLGRFAGWSTRTVISIARIRTG